MTENPTQHAESVSWERKLAYLLVALRAVDWDEVHGCIGAAQSEFSCSASDDKGYRIISEQVSAVQDALRLIDGEAGD